MTNAIAAVRELRIRVVRHPVPVLLTLIWLASTVAYLAHRGRIGEINLYLWQAQAFLDGTFEVPFAAQDAAVFGDRIFVPFPPFPALLLTPFVVIAGAAPFSVTLVALACTGATGAMLFQIFDHLGVQKHDRYWLTAGFLAGTGFWLMLLWSSGVWYFALVVGVTMLVGAIREALIGGRGWVVGLWLGAAVLTRQMMVYAIVVLAAALWTHPRNADRSSRLRSLIGLITVAGALAAFYPWFNWVRFGSPGETGYAYIQHADFLLDRFTAHGLFSIAYVPFNFASMFMQGPHLEFGGPDNLQFLGADLFGTSLTFASPFLFAAIAARGQRLLIGAATISVAATVIHQLLYHANGWVQINTVRYTLDFVPVLMVLVALGIQRLPSKLWKTAIAYSIGLNFLMVFVASAIPRLVRLITVGPG